MRIFHYLLVQLENVNCCLVTGPQVLIEGSDGKPITSLEVVQSATNLHHPTVVKSANHIV